MSEEQCAQKGRDKVRCNKKISEGANHMSTTSTAGIVRESLPWSIALSVLMIGAGLLAIALPTIAGIAVNIFVAWLLVFSGIVHLVFAWQTHSKRGMLWELLLGAVYVFIGGYMLLHPLLGLVSLTFALAAYLFAEGILELVLSFRLRPITGWGWLLFDGILTLILALMIWRVWPWSSEWAIGILVGISMLFSGVSRLMLSLAARRIVTKLA